MVVCLCNIILLEQERLSWIHILCILQEHSYVQISHIVLFSWVYTICATLSFVVSFEGNQFV
eukprot:c56174_g1_i1 orf=105-290(+)